MGCKKTKYPTEGKALQAAMRCLLRGSLPLRAYQCYECQAWHLTKKPVDVKKRGAV